MRFLVSSRSVTSTKMSTIGLAGSPGTAVLPKCSILRISSGGRHDLRCARSASNISGQRGSYGSIATSSLTARATFCSSVSIAFSTRLMPVNKKQSLAKAHLSAYGGKNAKVKAAWRTWPPPARSHSLPANLLLLRGRRQLLFEFVGHGLDLGHDQHHLFLADCH